MAVAGVEQRTYIYSERERERERKREQMRFSNPTSHSCGSYGSRRGLEIDAEWYSKEAKSIESMGRVGGRADRQTSCLATLSGSLQRQAKRKADTSTRQ